MKLKENSSKLLRSLTVNHGKRLYNADSQRAVSLIKEQIEQAKEADFKYPCPFCSISNLVYRKKKWHCDTCQTSYLAGSEKSDLLHFMNKNARLYYLAGKGVENSAYEQQGGFEQSAMAYKKIITVSYAMSKILLITFFWGFYQMAVMVFKQSFVMALLFLIMTITALLYSIFMAFKGYCLATRQMFLPDGMGAMHVKDWFMRVNGLYFLNVAKRNDINLADLINDFEQKEADGAIYDLGVYADDVPNRTS